MQLAFEDRRVEDLSTKELREALEARLVQEGLEDARAGRLRDVTPEYFETLRA